MKVGDKEFAELISQFERDLPKLPIYIGTKIEREKPIGKGRFFTNGTVNALFIGYMAGYESAKCLNRVGALKD